MRTDTGVLPNGSAREFNTKISQKCYACLRYNDDGELTIALHYDVKIKSNTQWATSTCVCIYLGVRIRTPQYVLEPSVLLSFIEIIGVKTKAQTFKNDD